MGWLVLGAGAAGAGLSVWALVTGPLWWGSGGLALAVLVMVLGVLVHLDDRDAR